MKHLVALTLTVLVVASFARGSGVNRIPVKRKSHSGIFGRITDPGGAEFPGARITIVCHSSKAILSLKSDSTGDYAIDLDPDIYDMTVEAQGFKTATRKSIRLVRKSRLQVDFVLQLAAPGSPKIIN
jgi:hypothetical protein